MEVDEDNKLPPMPPNVEVLMNDAQSIDWLNAIISVKNDVIGSNRQKTLVIQHGLIPRLLRWLEDDSIGMDLRTEVANVLGSLAKGNFSAIMALVQEKTVPILLKSLTHINLRYTEAVLRCLRSIFLQNTDSISCLYEENRFGSSYIPHLLGMIPYSAVCQECITSVLERGCRTTEHQMCLLESRALPILSPLLLSEFYKVQMPTLRCFAHMCYKNSSVCKAVVAEDKLVEVFVELMARDKPSEMQMAAAKVLTYLHRGGAIAANDFIISRKTLGTLVRMCKRDRPLEENVQGAETLAYLVEVDPDLQMTASITDHLISTLAHYLNYKDVKKISSCDKKEVDWGTEMKKAAFLAFASISANDEEIREKVIKREGMIDQILASLASPDDTEVISSLRCLHSLTRSVQQIRTVLHDNAVWRPLFQRVSSHNKEMQVLAIACVCNLLLEFSPSKDDLVTKTRAVEILCELSSCPDNDIRFNAVWSLMSLSYCAPEELRVRLITTLGPESLVRRIQDPELPIREKALGIVRNLLMGKTTIDKTVKLLGSEVFEAIFNIIKKSGQPVEIIEQALCVVSNMADGPSCKAHIIGKTEDIQHVVKYLQYPEKRLQLPAIQFISNLVDSSDDGSYQRMLTLKDLGVQCLLETLVGTLCEEVDTRAQQALKSFA